MNAAKAWRDSLGSPAIVFITSVFMSSHALACDKSVEPDSLLLTISSDVIESFNQNFDEIRKDPGFATGVIEQVLTPHVDFELASRRVLADNWSDLSNEQRERFKTAFRTFLVRHSSVVLAGYMTDNDKMLDKDMFQFDKEIKRQGNIATVKSIVVVDGVKKHDVGYKLRCAETWRIYDVQINGISMIKQYINQFKYKIAADGFSGLIAYLNYKNEEMLALLSNQSG